MNPVAGLKGRAPRVPLKAVEYWASIAALAVSERNKAIARAHDSGLSLRVIADKAGITHPAVKKIIDKAMKEKQ